jgi:peptidoglycan-associated lipoprotein
MNKLLLSLSILVLVAACSKQAVKEEPKASVEDKSPGAQSETGQVPPAEALDGQMNKGKAPPKDAKGPLGQRSIYFDYDSNVVKEEYKPVVQAHAKFLQENAGAKVTLQGNTDERGSREYNLALGQKRSDSVRKMVNVLGIADSQVESVSFGEEKPRKEGHDEEAWKENRRVDIVYQGE